MNLARKKIVIVFASAIILLSACFSSAFAWHEGKEVTPYGDSCRLCTDYGTCDSPMSNEGAKRAIIEYYHAKGLNVMIETNRGRFIKAKIINKNDVVDVIIFDRRTGRVRSIY
ncbi:MAG: hypothetical protein HY807_07635 [Nitrospirae bacterium]|nr:hypothetical protein [Nitrospirota bacterium]